MIKARSELKPSSPDDRRRMGIGFGTLTCISRILIITLSGLLITGPGDIGRERASIPSKAPRQNKLSSLEPADAISRSGRANPSAQETNSNVPRIAQSLLADADLWNAITVASRDKDPDGLLRVSEEFIVAHPERWDGYMARAEAWALKNAYPQAIKDYSIAIQKYPENSHLKSLLFFQRADYMISLSDIDAKDVNLSAINIFADLDEAIRLNPSFAEALFKRGGMRLRSRDYLRGILDIKAAVRLDQNNPKYKYLLKNAEKMQALDGNSVPPSGQSSGGGSNQGPSKAATSEPVMKPDSAIVLEPDTGLVEEAVRADRRKTLEDSSLNPIASSLLIPVGGMAIVFEPLPWPRSASRTTRSVIIRSLSNDIQNPKKAGG